MKHFVCSWWGGVLKFEVSKPIESTNSIFVTDFAFMSSPPPLLCQIWLELGDW